MIHEWGIETLWYATNGRWRLLSELTGENSRSDRFCLATWRQFFFVMFVPFHCVTSTTTYRMYRRIACWQSRKMMAVPFCASSFGHVCVCIYTPYLSVCIADMEVMQNGCYCQGDPRERWKNAIERVVNFCVESERKKKSEQISEIRMCFPHCKRPIKDGQSLKVEAHIYDRCRYYRKNQFHRRKAICLRAIQAAH